MKSKYGLYYYLMSILWCVSWYNLGVIHTENKVVHILAEVEESLGKFRKQLKGLDCTREGDTITCKVKEETK